MDVDGLIEAYVEDVSQLLPRKQRGDVALELRELVREELQSRAAAQGRPLDADIALEGLRAFGSPPDVAARYCEPRVIIPQAQTRRFAFAAIVGALVLIALSFFDPGPSQADEVGTAILAWLGVLVLFFGFQSVNPWRRDVARQWVARDRDSVNRFGSLALIAVICAGIVAYGAPGWLYAQLVHGHPLPASLDYDPTFRAVRLPVLFVVWGCQAALFAVLAVTGRWNPTLRKVDLALEVALGLVLIWFVAAGSIVEGIAANRAALGGLSAFALLIVISAGIKLYRGSGRVPPPGAPQAAPPLHPTSAASPR